MNAQEKRKIMQVLISMQADGHKLRLMKQLSLNTVEFAIDRGLDPIEVLVALATTIAMVGRVSDVPLRELVAATVKCYEEMYAKPDAPTMQ